MSITKVITYRVEVEFDSRAWELFRDSLELDFEIIQACRGSLAAGSDSYGRVYHWAEFATHGDALLCEERLNEVADRWKAKAIQYDADAAREEQA